MSEYNLNFNPEDYPDKKCCGVAEHLTLSGWKYPLSLVYMGTETYWGIKFHQRDERLMRINEGKSATLMMKYCPFCGVELKE